MRFSSAFKQSSSLKTKGFKTSNFSPKQKQICFDYAMKSVNLQHFIFTNFLFRKSPTLKLVRTQYFNLKNGKFNLEDSSKYAPSIVNLSNPYLELKLKTIIEKTRNVKVDKLPIIYKFKSKEMPEFQIYVANNLNNEYEVLAIDLYHLLIPAPDKSRGEKTEHSQEKYDSVKFADYNLSEIVNKS